MKKIVISLVVIVTLLSMSGISTAAKQNGDTFNPAIYKNLSSKVKTMIISNLVESLKAAGVGASKINAGFINALEAESKRENPGFGGTNAKCCSGDGDGNCDCEDDGDGDCSNC